MRYYTEILRFQEGVRSQHPAFEALVQPVPAECAPDVGMLVAVLVDLSPALPHRSRELRTIVAETYWASSGSIVARLRRALAEANRHLVNTNMAVPPGTKAAGSLTCAVLGVDELFLGQVGQAHAMIAHTDGPWELFPRRDRLLIPLGGTLPPVIHIGYTPLEIGSSLLLATRPVAEAVVRERWLEILAEENLTDMVVRITDTLSSSATSGSMILAHCVADEQVEETPASVPSRRLWPFTKRDVAPVPSVSLASDETQSPAVQHVEQAEAEAKASLETGSLAELFAQARAKAEEAHGVRQTTTEKPVPDATPPTKPVEEASDEVQDAARKRPAFKLPRIPLPRINWPTLPSLKDIWQRLAEKRQARQAWQASPERERLRNTIQTLLPGQVEGVSPKVRTVPQERMPVMAGLSMGVLFVMVFIVLSTYFQFGGASRAQSMLDEVQAAHNTATVSQDVEDWHSALRLAEQVLTLDPQNEEAATFKEEAQLAIDALESAAVLDVNLLLDLGPAPTPRDLLVADSWIYVLNTATDEVVGLTLDDTGLSAVSDAPPTTILKRGQTFYGEMVGHLVEIVWMAPGPSYPDGAVFIYSEGGVLYIYEPSLGPNSITRQRLQGELKPGMVTLVAIYGDPLYLVQRQLNQILKYIPVNGLYDSPPRPYFAPGMAPPLQTALDLAIDGRIYLLFGDGSLVAYYEGTEDPAFEVQGLPDPNFQPMVMVIESDFEAGRIYLGDSHRERIVVLDKKGHFLHQFRLIGETLRQLEALAIDEERRILYLVAANRLYAARLPQFAQ